MNSVDERKLGEMLKWYIKESNHSGWDGYSRREGRGVIAFLQDFVLWCENYDMTYPQKEEKKK